MYNAQRLETIRKNIKASTLLSDHEKSDWLNLLELMNDKQLGELEEILAAESPAISEQTANIQHSKPASSASPAAAQTPAPNQQLPPLTHIANIPTDVTIAPPPPLKPLTARPTPSPNLSNMPRRSDLGNAQAASPSKPRAPLPTSTNVRVPAPSPAPRPAAPVTAQPKPRPRPKTEEIYSITDPEDLRHLSAEIIRTHSLQSVFDAIRTAIEENGYFAILQLVEASPLYISYMNTGKQRLGAQLTPGEDAAANPPADPESILTQEEFEFMTDLLRNMRFNRW